MESTSPHTYCHLNQHDTLIDDDIDPTPQTPRMTKHISADIFNDLGREVIAADTTTISMHKSTCSRIKATLLGINCFTVVVCFYILCFFMTEMYLVAVITTIEKRFGFKSSSSGMLISGKEMAYVCVVALLGYCGNKWHRPRFLACVAIIGAIGSALSAAPHFLYDSPFHVLSQQSHLSNEPVHTQLCNSQTKSDIQSTNATARFSWAGSTSTIVAAMLSDNDTLLVIGPNGMLTSNITQSTITDITNRTLDGECGSGHVMSHNDRAYAIFMVSNVIIGFSMSPMIALTTTYVDDAVGPVRNAMYIAFMNMMHPLGPVLAFLMGAVFLSWHEAMEDPGYGPSDPNWVGAWWVGYLVTPCLLFVAGVLIAFFPKIMNRDPQDEDKELELKASTKRKVGEENDNFITDIAAAISRLLCNPIFMCLMFGGCFSSFILSGMFPFMPKYMEVQFHLSTSMANAFSGMLGALISGIGVLLGGILSSSMKWHPTQSALFIVIANVIFVMTIILMMLVTCPTISYTNTNSLANDTCSAKCGCLGDQFAPVCGSDGETYMSACWAGCQTHYTNETYGDCVCIAGSGAASGGSCDPGCQMWMVYVAVLAAGALIGTMASVPGTTVCLRCVEERDRCLAMGLIGTVVSLVGFLPGPALYGFLIDSTCINWQESCGETGYCRIYDNDSFRLWLHGTTAILKGVAVIFYFLVWVLMKRENKKLKLSTILSKDVNAEPSPSLESTV